MGGWGPRCNKVLPGSPSTDVANKTFSEGTWPFGALLHHGGPRWAKVGLRRTCWQGQHLSAYISTPHCLCLQPEELIGCVWGCVLGPSPPSSRRDWGTWGVASGATDFKAGGWGDRALSGPVLRKEQGYIRQVRPTWGPHLEPSPGARHTPQEVVGSAFYSQHLY